MHIMFPSPQSQERRKNEFHLSFINPKHLNLMTNKGGS